MSRTEQLIGELKEIRSQYYSTCSHGAIRYPVQWMSKTQEKIVKIGLAKKCEKCCTSEYNYYFLSEQ